jgi:tetratricopeptide (TPR) repeat protein
MASRSALRAVTRGFVGVVCLLPLLAMLAPGQVQIRLDQAHSKVGNEGMLLLSVRAADSKKALDRQSVVKITNLSAQTVGWKTTDDKSEAAIGLPPAQYEIEVSAVGYLSERKKIQVVSSIDTVQLEIHLSRDPSAVDLDIADAAMPPKGRGDLKHAISALKSGNFQEAKKKLDAAYKLAPSNPDLNYLMGYLYYQQKDFAQAQTYLTAAANISSRNVRVLTLLGNVQLTQKDYAGAAASLEKAVDSESGNWMAHNLLASAYLGLKKYEPARQEAEMAIAEGKTAASGANVVLGQALVNLGKKDEGIRVLQAFIQNSPTDPSVPQVRNFIAKVVVGGPESLPDSGGGGERKTDASLAGVDPLFIAPELPVSVNPWRPPGIDEAKPSVSEGVNCPFESVIDMSGQRVKELVDNVSRIAAIERLLHEQVNEMGNPTSRETRDYDYVATIAERTGGGLGVDEDRFERLTKADSPDGISSSGFAILALIFHPNMRQDFEMTCEGLGRWQGRATWLIHFKQRPDRAPRMVDFKLNGNIYPVRLKGRAWIAADTFEIVRIESELISPIAEIRLRCQQQVVEYGPVKFPRKNLELWLPTRAEIYLDYRNHRYYRSHTYDHYMLFSVDSTDKPKSPTTPPSEPSEKAPS